jgi:hypothetical protein
MHDSFLVPEADADILSHSMTEVANEYGLQFDLKDSGGQGNLPPPPFHLGVTTADL